MELQNFHMRNEHSDTEMQKEPAARGELVICILVEAYKDWKVSSAPRTWQVFFIDLEMNWATVEIYGNIP